LLLLIQKAAKTGGAESRSLILGTGPAAARQKLPHKEALRQSTSPPTAETFNQPRQECPPPDKS
jgi:hypothetical protein